MSILFFSISILISLTGMVRLHKMLMSGINPSDWFLPLVPVLSGLLAIAGFWFV